MIQTGIAVMTSSAQKGQHKEKQEQGVGVAVQPISKQKEHKVWLMATKMVLYAQATCSLPSRSEGAAMLLQLRVELT